MATCCDQAEEDHKVLPNSKTILNSSRFSLISPVVSALLHSSCCWLPTLLDFFSFGSASASQFQTLRPFFFWATLLILAESVRRNGLDRRAFFRITISGFFLALPQLSQFTKRAANQGANQGGEPSELPLIGGATYD
ncbi:hypothetical protein PAAG_08126 [Paracoccidioides lutzii Pb01]|uniref:Uncharacterized protein n=1 Tax=Paracoccidioides lutzii (strain ATCC MYA-826 / Pb01) TaxID=502779 RepID=C1HBI5_PARBA|nr:hypothetical protein PAAG_08126 [Paracoccidioides lutzii Pb01]EEH37708.2 hypothetical protein PAAG_08126 [Paracoccidioides lutzii Pb01]